MASSGLRAWIFANEEPFQNQARVFSLYSDFARLKATNLDGYIANCSAWKGALSRACRAGVIGDSLVLTAGDDLLRSLYSDDCGRPLSLGCVFSDAVADGSMFPLRDFLTSTQSVYARRGWLAALPSVSAGGVARWLLAQAGVGAGSAGDVPKGSFVVLSNVEEAAQAVLKKVAETADTSTSLVYSIDTFTHTFANLRKNAPRLSGRDVSVLIRFLARDKHAVTLGEDSKGEITAIKFAAPTAQHGPTAVTEHDKTIASLRSLVMKLHVQVDALHPRIADLDKTARSELAANHRERALAALRRRKALEATLGKREASLAQIEDVLGSIDEAAGQVEMVQAMEASAGVLRSLNAQVGGAARVDAVVDALRENMADTDEVSRILAEPGAEAVDESEVGEEMAALEAEAAEKERKIEEKKAESLLEGAPSAPQDAVKAPETDKKEDELEKRLDALSL